MMDLTWIETGQDGLEARGDSWTYLIAWDDRTVVLTRYDTYYSGPGRHGRERDAALVARQAALTAIQICTGDGPTRMAALASVRTAAQMFESGLDVTGQPAW